MIQIKRVMNQEEFNDAFSVRQKVFIEEQGVPENIEKDALDSKALYVIAIDNEKVIGCGRLVDMDGKAKMGRMAVLKEYRGQGVGTLLGEALFQLAIECHFDSVYVHAQHHALDFYKKLGFETHGEPFYEADILHIKMTKCLKAHSTIIIGIAGGTGSGKTTLVRKLKEALGDEVLTITHDYYYKANQDLPFEERKKLNYDHPDAFDTDMMIEHLKMLKRGMEIERPIYDFTLHTRKEETVLESPKKVIIVEGILIFENVELRKLFDIKVFVDTDADVRIIRRILRDVKERGRDLDNVITQYLGTVKLMHEEFVEPSKKFADIIIPEGGYNKVALSMLLDKIRILLKEANRV